MEAVTSKELMEFLTTFKKSVEEKIQETNVNIEDKIQKMDDKLDSRLHDINVVIDDNMEKVELEMQKLNAKMEKNENVATRMEGRLDKLENQMKKSEEIGRKAAKLRNIQEDLLNQPERSKSIEYINPSEQNQPGGRKVIENQPKKQFNRQRIETKDLINENKEPAPVPYRSDWAKEVEEELAATANMQGDKVR